MERINPQAYTIPMVIEQNQRGERVFDIYSRLLKDNVIFLGTAIDDQVASLVIGRRGTGLKTF